MVMWLDSRTTMIARVGQHVQRPYNQLVTKTLKTTVEDIFPWATGYECLRSYTQHENLRSTASISITTPGLLTVLKPLLLLAGIQQTSSEDALGCKTGASLPRASSFYYFVLKIMMFFMRCHPSTMLPATYRHLLSPGTVCILEGICALSVAQSPDYR